jgi:predicted Rossmann fold flavoprotein
MLSVVIERDVIIAGGGAAGMFAAITCAESCPRLSIAVLEKSPQFLSKVRISGGGRCNVTHACFEPERLSQYYPRGARALLGPFARFQPNDTAAWFAARGVRLKTESDGRMFPASDTSRTIVDCLMKSAGAAGVEMRANCGLNHVAPKAGAGFELDLGNGEIINCRNLMLATGGCRAATAGQLALSLGHTLEPPVPSLFAFQVAEAGLQGLAGISMQDVEAYLKHPRLSARGALVVTHGGFSGPAILKLSAWGARELHATDYRFPVRINWQPGLGEHAVASELERCRHAQPAKLIVNTPLAGIPSRLWEYLVQRSGIRRETRWANLARSEKHRLVLQLTAADFDVVGKSLNKDEFVTCGGVRLKEVNFKTMESRICPGLFFGGELLDIDGSTGGFNFQAAWTTGWIAGQAMAAALSDSRGLLSDD